MAGAHPVRVVQVISSFHPLVGGAEQATLRLCQQLGSLGADVRVLTRMHPGLTRTETVGGVTVHRLGIPAASKLGAPFFIVHVLWVLATRLRSWRVVHAQGTDAQLIASVVAKVLLRKKVVLTIHSDPVLRLRMASGGGPRFGAVRDHVHAVGVLGPHMVPPLVEGGIPEERIVELSNGVDVDRFAPVASEVRDQRRHEEGVEASAFVAVFVGRLIPLKRVDLLIQSWHRVFGDSAANATLLVVGDGPERASLEEIAGSGSGDVRFLGRHDQPEKILSIADLFVLPSQREGQSMALLEAMASGVVPLVSDLPPNLGVVENGRTGFTFTTDDGDALVGALIEARDGDLGPMAEAAVSQVRARNSLRSTAQTHLDLYSRLELYRGESTEHPR